MNGLEALETISMEWFGRTFAPKTERPGEEKYKMFDEWFKNEYKIIKDELIQYENLKKELKAIGEGKIDLFKNALDSIGHITTEYCDSEGCHETIAIDVRTGEFNIVNGAIEKLEKCLKMISESKEEARRTNSCIYWK